MKIIGDISLTGKNWKKVNEFLGISNEPHDVFDSEPIMYPFGDMENTTLSVPIVDGENIEASIGDKVIKAEDGTYWICKRMEWEGE